MIRFAALGACCLLLIVLGAHAEAQTVTTGESLFGVFKPYLTELASVFVAALAAWLFKLIREKLGIDIEAKHRDALQAALTNAAGLVINRAGGLAGALALPNANPLVQQGVSYVIDSAPDALRHFGITPEEARRILTEKLEAKIGVLISTGAAAKA
ncbi:hypothetical protein [Bosea sp. FBZP-16]|uniref:hypothetical protein n=1 Tax=Bosea sp. FBZP-16 TaxID=2065382 RepID=UPI00131A0F41|nr:hypothetical protein [Bosea sp. FBZP-16]